MMGKRSMRLWIVREPPPDKATHMAWFLEASRLGFTGRQALMLCYWRWWARVDPRHVTRPGDTDAANR